MQVKQASLWAFESSHCVIDLHTYREYGATTQMKIYFLVGIEICLRSPRAGPRSKGSLFALLTIRRSPESLEPQQRKLNQLVFFSGSDSCSYSFIGSNGEL